MSEHDPKQAIIDYVSQPLGPLEPSPPPPPDVQGQGPQPWKATIRAARCDISVHVSSP